MVAQVHPDCLNASNPYHECTDYCFQRISERKSVASTSGKVPGEVYADLPKEFGRKRQQRKAVPSENSGHIEELIEEEEEKGPPPNVFARPVDGDDDRVATGRVRGRECREDEEANDNAGCSGEGEGGEEEGDGGSHSVVPVNDAPTYENMSARQKKLFDLRMKLNQARMANQNAVVLEKHRVEKAEEKDEEKPRGMSKAAWYEEKKKRMGKILDANGLDMTRAYMLDTQAAAEEKYKKREKKEAAFGWDVFNTKSLYKAYKKRAANVPIDMEDYQKQKESDPDFYRDSSCLEYGKAQDVPEENVDRMVAELQERGTKRKEFSRRRRHHDEKDIDSINDRNEHFNRKIERAFGKYTVEIKNNLERGTALPE